MILGHIADVSRQGGVLPEVIRRAIETVQKIDAATLTPGRYPIEGEELFYIIEDATPRAVEDCHPEVHRSYADIQIPVSTTERFGFSLPQPGIAAVTEEFEERDLGFYATPANEFFLDVAPGSYIVFLPGELHRPCVATKDTTPFRKVVIKVHARLLGL
ncbi:YhcH/YjgK/YiaL family protein [Propionivibrio limicola]|uniref:YhcH/YjgK/YiaL family protein n=1 Tax=Propionivibrio limicola TaxID=167645 RepID=UPI00147898B5|nr:YhcH/YjgK/YiaL family protein [Propionivibrio limicola]